MWLGWPDSGFIWRQTTLVWPLLEHVRHSQSAAGHSSSLCLRPHFIQTLNKDRSDFNACTYASETTECCDIGFILRVSWYVITMLTAVRAISSETVSAEFSRFCWIFSLHEPTTKQSINISPSALFSRPAPAPLIVGPESCVCATFLSVAAKSLTVSPLSCVILLNLQRSDRLMTCGLNARSMCPLFAHATAYLVILVWPMKPKYRAHRLP